MTTRRRLVLGIVGALAAAFLPSTTTLGAARPDAAPVRVTYYFLPG